MIRTQISLTAKDYTEAKAESRRQGISLAEFMRRALVTALAPRRKKEWREKPWLRWAGAFNSGDPKASRTVDEVVYGSDRP